MPILALLARIRMPSCKASSKAKGISTLRFTNHHGGPHFRTFAALPIGLGLSVTTNIKRPTNAPRESKYCPKENGQMLGAIIWLQ